MLSEKDASFALRLHQAAIKHGIETTPEEVAKVTVDSDDILRSYENQPRLTDVKRIELKRELTEMIIKLTKQGDE